MTEKTTEFQNAELKGGPHNGQQVIVPTDQDALTFYDDGEPHTYFRLGGRPVFYHATHPQIRAWTAGRGQR